MNGAELIAHERSRQIAKEGYAPEHDDEHEDGELAMAAACYAAPVPIRAEILVSCGCRSAGECTHVFGPSEWKDPWPWDPEWDKRKKHDRIKQLVIAGALCAAEIDRLKRTVVKNVSEKPAWVAAGVSCRRLPCGSGCRILKVDDDKKQALVKGGNSAQWVKYATLAKKWKSP